MSEQTEEIKTKYFPTKSGVSVEIVGISPLLIQRLEDQYAEDNPPPVPPTYTVKTAGGGEEVHPHDETTVETAQEKSALKSYQKLKAAWDRGLERKTIRLMVLAGIKFDIPETDEWKSTPLALGLRIPTDPAELKIFYFETTVISNVQEMVAVMGLVMGLDKAKGESDEDTVMKMFQATVPG